MASVVPITEPAPEAGTPSLPANVEAEAAFLGALMLDNRLVEDVGLKLKAHHFHEELHGRIYDSILKLTDKNMVANPVTLRPMFEADEAMKQVGGAGFRAPGRTGRPDASHTTSATSARSAASSARSSE